MQKYDGFSYGEEGYFERCVCDAKTVRRLGLWSLRPYDCSVWGEAVGAWMRRHVEDSRKGSIKKLLSQSGKEDFLSCGEKKRKLDWGKRSGTNGE